MFLAQPSCIAVMRPNLAYMFLFTLLLLHMGPASVAYSDRWITMSIKVSDLIPEDSLYIKDSFYISDADHSRC